MIQVFMYVIFVTYLGQCAMEHILSCYNDLTKALDVPNLRLSNQDVSMETINALLDPYTYIVQNEHRCK